MELISEVINHNNRRVHLFDERSGIGDLVWEASPIKRFKFRGEVSDFEREMFKFNEARVGTIFKGQVYIWY